MVLTTLTLRIGSVFWQTNYELWPSANAKLRTKDTAEDTAYRVNVTLIYTNDYRMKCWCVYFSAAWVSPKARIKAESIRLRVYRSIIAVLTEVNFKATALQSDFDRALTNYRRHPGLVRTARGRTQFTETSRWHVARRCRKTQTICDCGNKQSHNITLIGQGLSGLNSLAIFSFCVPIGSSLSTAAAQ